MNSIIQHKSKETNIGTKNDKILIGLLNLCDRIFSFNEDIKKEAGDKTKQYFVMEVFSKCLFDISAPEDLEKVNIIDYDT